MRPLQAVPLRRTVDVCRPADGSLEAKLVELTPGCEATAGTPAAVAAYLAVRDVPDDATSLNLTVDIALDGTLTLACSARSANAAAPPKPLASVAVAVRSGGQAAVELS